jgi:hypothetical protein
LKKDPKKRLQSMKARVSSGGWNEGTVLEALYQCPWSYKYKIWSFMLVLYVLMFYFFVTKDSLGCYIKIKGKGVNYWLDLIWIRTDSNTTQSDPTWSENKWVGYESNFLIWIRLGWVRVNLTRLIMFFEVILWFSNN